MGDDVICIDSDDDDEDDVSHAGRTLGTRASAGRRSGGRGYWQQRRKALRERKKRDLQTVCRPLVGLLDGLRRLNSELSLGGVPNHSVAQRAQRLVADFGRHLMPASDRQEGWRQVLRFLLVLRTFGGRFESADGEADGHGKDHSRSSKRRQSYSRYQLTVIDILVDYIRFRCETLTARQPPATPSVLLHECNRIVTNLFAIFDGSVELVTLTLLRTPPEPRYTMLLYPVFEAILTDRSGRCGGVAGTIPSYVRMLLCFKRWRSLAVGRTDKAVIDAQAGHFLPARCPTVLNASDVPFLRLLPAVPAAQRVNETRYLMANDLFSLDRCVAQFFRHHRRMSPAAADERQLSGIAPRPATTTTANRPTALEASSNYINATLMAELIERKGQLWARAFPAPAACLLPEAHSIVESLRMIFCQRTEFIELTLLLVPASPEHAPLLAPIFAAFLATPADPGLTAAPITTPTGLTIYRSNDVETYGRLILCYAKWKALYQMSNRADDGAPEPTEWTHVDTIALSQLPFDFPRVLCARDARLRKVFPSYASNGTGPVAAGVMAPVRGSNHTVTRFLLRTLPKRADLQELCLQFIEAYRSGLQKVEPQPIRIPGNDSMTCSAAYKSMSASLDRTDRKQPSVDDDGTATSGQPTLRTEMKPIIIPDSDDGDEMSASDTILSVSMSTMLVQAALCPAAVSGSPGTTLELDRNTSSTPTPSGEFDCVVSGAPIPWPPFTVECFLNTPPATPQQEVNTESAEEDHRRCLTVKKPPLPSWCRLKGTVRSIERRGKKRTTAGFVALRHTLRRLFDGGVGGGGWWSFADVLAVQVPLARNVRWCSSIINVPTIPVDGCTADTYLLPNRTASFNSHELLSDRSYVARESAPSDATLLELINCLDAGDSSSSFGSTQACVDFVIPPDNPGRADLGHPSAMNDQASPSAFETPVDTSPLFASASDRFVHLVTELGPVSWPIV
ncbi:uncharacterized protein LOC131294487 [Anopheles ziemanni]|uniref:uncharacterized protein LOC131294487 n=1 Tax=Anopheles ziemanni TaxID=345580 RepID=UPI00265E1077|nr:uncharacterized protein LOC131294487 [Anopheles ziemanni]